MYKNKAKNEMQRNKRRRARKNRFSTTVSLALPVWSNKFEVLKFLGTILPRKEICLVS